ncbi:MULTISPECIES: hypothetical protein [Flectobacillus]|jgi:hypothetical protein|uniref:Uncharacterized protein n=1 Tax=Flectobacillus roseus TaxID=502259 RepID=A0ABT6Y3U0_9BACT|nr:MULTISPECIES: hypothetical protein [Flectobacillus]MDI9858129.1 hypothetical protein [Flectobacillus roseus]MDI9867945.1 hypothetical protein [Flectobacillus roseus]NBA73965.1 hypothetical protein [Emticicia sp. ODNR4P]PAC27389.1 hypothetical protein BWI92_22705 [Flectobacillus sp. BAB-3569]
MALLKNIMAFLFGSAESDYPVLGKNSKLILSDANMAEQLLSAIDRDRNSENIITISGTKGSFRVERVSEI